MRLAAQSLWSLKVGRRTVYLVLCQLNGLKSQSFDSDLEVLCEGGGKTKHQEMH